MLPGLVPGAIAFAILLLAVALLAGPGRVGWLRLLPGVLAFASVTWSSWLLADPRDLGTAVFAGLRIAYFVIPGIVFAAFIDPSALGDHLGQRLHFCAPPCSRPSLPSTGSTPSQPLGQIAQARRIRGLGPRAQSDRPGRHVASMTFTLLVQALRQAERMSVAMEARGYGLLGRPGYRRTWAGPALAGSRHRPRRVVCRASGAAPTGSRSPSSRAGAYMRNVPRATSATRPPT